MKRKSSHIVCFALPAWEAEYLRSTVELMKCASVNNLVLYVDYAYTISDFFKGMFGKKKFDWKRLIGLKKRLRKVNDNGNNGLWVLSLPPVLPSFIFKSYKLFTLANKINAAITGYFINRAIKKLQMRDIIGFNAFQPFLGNYWAINNIQYNVYYIYDDFTTVPWFKGFVAAEEAKFIDKTDLVIVSSAELKKRRSQISKPVKVVNNGVHFDAFFDQITNRKLNDGYIKTVGYTGTMDSRIDIDLLEQVIKDMPGTRFLFVGKVREQRIYERLLPYINVCFEPPVPAASIPGLQRQIDVGIIPYVRNKMTAAIYPLKANEYLAMGLAVVMTPFASLGAADRVIYTAADAASFMQKIETALNENDEQLINDRISMARKSDWRERARQLINIIDLHRFGGSVQENRILVENN